jgi:hypothetical protein
MHRADTGLSGDALCGHRFLSGGEPEGGDAFCIPALDLRSPLRGIYDKICAARG